MRALVGLGAREEAEDVFDEDVPDDLDHDFSDNEPDHDPLELRVVLVRQLLAQDVETSGSFSQSVR